MRRGLAVATAAALAGCVTGPQSALEPHGEDAARVAVLAWTIFAGAVIILAGVAAATLVAVAGPERWRRRIAGDGFIRWNGIALPTVTLALLLGWSLWLMRAEAGRPAALTVDVTGERWWFRMRYAGDAGGALGEANELRVPVGREVDLVLRSADVIHSFWAPSLGGKLDMMPGRVNTLRLKADRPGVYRGQCAEYCGGPHAQMAFEVVAMPEDEFARWLQAQPAAPASEQALRGAALFQAAGCGSCHNVRGTPAAGAVGPDLSRVGARRFIAAGTLANTPENLRRFIVEGQSVKPGNRMPEFRIFSAPELDAIAAYLTELR